MDSKKEVLERLDEGLVSEEELKKLVRIQIQKRLQWGYKPTYQEQLSFHLDFINSLKQMKISGNMDTINSESYELPISFLQTMFGKTLKQSCCYFTNESMTIDEAEIAMNDLHCERAEIKNGQRILDIGCGQGSLIFHIANKYPNCLLTGITNSCVQKNFIEEQCRNLKLSNVIVILGDVTEHEMEDTFDRILIVEAIEHMKNIQIFFKKISKWMKEDGILFVDHVCHKVFPEHFEELDDEDWYSEYLFPKGSLTIHAASTLLYFQDDLSVMDHWIINGNNMALTHEKWLKNLVKNNDVAKNVLQLTFGSKEAAEKCMNHCRNFHLAMSEQFLYNNGEEWMISHVLLKKR